MHEEVFPEEVDDAELGAAAGGTEFDADRKSCTQVHTRPIYGADGKSFSNCVATVETGSFCDPNGACYRPADEYLRR